MGMWIVSPALCRNRPADRYFPHIVCTRRDPGQGMHLVAVAIQSSEMPSDFLPPLFQLDGHFPG